MSAANTSTVATGRPTDDATTDNVQGPRENPLSIGSSTLFMVIFAFYFLAPIWWLFVASSKTQENILGTNGLWFASPFKLFTNIVPLIIAFVSLQRFWRSGLAAGGVK